MSEQSDPPTGNPDESTTAASPSAPRPPAALQGYPPEAAPEADEDTVPVAVPGEQTDPGRRLDVFPEDADTDGPTG